MQSHMGDFLFLNDATHKRAQSIADAVNAKDPEKCLVKDDGVLVKHILACLSSLSEHVKNGIPNVIITCGHDPSVLFMVGDTPDAKSTCMGIRLCVCDWENPAGTATK
jgi:hypothetical protein